jgi:hypothetical protein
MTKTRVNVAERAVIARNNRNIFRIFASHLSVKFGRKIDGEKDGLTCGDFAYETVVLTFEDHSELRFESAFVVEGDECYGVFTEHAGYHCFYKESLIEVKILFPGDRRRKPKYLKMREDTE